jgi:hypothetical protein
MSQKPPFDIAKAAMVLLGLLILTGCAVILMVTFRCTVWAGMDCADKTGQRIHEFLAETIPVLVAIAMGWKMPPGPPPSKPPAVGEDEP